MKKKKNQPMKAKHARKLITTALLCGRMAGSLVWLRVGAQQQMPTDAGTLDKATAEKCFPNKPPYSPYAGRNVPTRPLFGDTHLHTSFSMDAGAFGCRLGPREAYRFARGEEITASNGQPAKLSRPLDFLRGSPSRARGCARFAAA